MTFTYRKHKSDSRFTFALFSLALVVIGFVANAVEAQSEAQRGSPLGSYKISDLETIDYFTGNMSFDLPLAAIGGRGGTGFAPLLHIERDWAVPVDNQNVMETTEYRPYTLISGSGRLVQYNVADGPTECDYWNETLTYFEFTEPNGTRHKLTDPATAGSPHIWHANCNSNTAETWSRGRYFEARETGGAAFYADSDVLETVLTSPNVTSADGLVLLPNGTKYRIDGGRVSWIQDRNGNKTTFTYVNGYQSAVASATDSLGRQLTFEYNVDDQDQYGLHDKITYKGTGGTDRIVRITKRDLDDANVLGSGFSIQPNSVLMGNPYASTTSSAPLEQVIYPHEVYLPDGRKYTFQYNEYGELARVVLPTGGSYQYDYAPKDSDFDSGYESPVIQRRLTERRIYDENSVPVRTTTISDLSSYPKYYSWPANVSVIVEERGPGSMLLAKTKHYYRVSPYRPIPTSTDNELLHGKETKTENFALDGTTVLNTVEKTWAATIITPNPPYPGQPLHARITEKRVTISGSNNLVSKETYTYNAHNYVTDTYSYDFGAGSPGSLLSRSHTDYVTDSNYTAYTGPFLRGLPSQTWVSSDSGGSNKVSLTVYEYDNYSSNSTHAALVSRSSVTGHNSINYGTGFAYRGNVTAVTSYANAAAPSGGVTTYSQYDILGNVVRTIDANGNATTIDYVDNFGSADSDATTNSTPSQISGYSTFAFPTSTTNPMSWTSYTQYDYFTGQVVNLQDVNGLISKNLYDDDLDRLTQTFSAIGTANEIQRTINYDDSNRRVEVTSDLFDLNDNLAKSELLYDGLGRTIEERLYRVGNYVRTDTQYDGLGRVLKVSNPYRPGLSETAVWTETSYDGLGRVVSIETPDGAEIKKAYDADRTLSVDQAGKKRIARVNALGLLKDVWEVKGADADTVSVNFPGPLGSGINYGYQTTYSYDTLGNLTGVDQGSNDRSFAYDHLSRLTSSTNPESGTVTLTYDANGNVKTRRDARNIKTVFDYDALNRVTERCYRSIGGGSLGMTTCVANSETAEPNTPDVNYTYEDVGVTSLKGVLTEITNGTSTTEYTSFDATGRITGHKQTTDSVQYTTGYTYYLSGAVNETTYPSGRVVKSVLDTLDGTLSQVQSKRSGGTFRNFANGFIFNAAGAVQAMRLGNGLWENAVYNDRLQTTQIGLGSGVDSQSKLKINYGYGATDNNGNLQSQTITTPGVAHTFNQTYTYDALNRIETAEETYNSATKWKQEFTYDRYGNRRFVEANTSTLPKNCVDGMSNAIVCTADAPVVNPQITSNNMLTGSTYDASGNVVEDGAGWEFVYDGDNKQVEAINDSSVTVGEYSYDGNGRRVKKYNPDTGETTVFVYGVSGMLIAEYDTTIQTAGNAKTVYMTGDALGSPRINTDGVGAVVARHDYHPFGEEIATAERASGVGYTSDTVRQQFTGYERDQETGLDFAQARYFNSGHGRFSSPDPLDASASAALPQSWNRYAYVYNNPYRYNDPTGMCGQLVFESNWNAGCDTNDPPTSTSETNTAGKQTKEKIPARGWYLTYTFRENETDPNSNVVTSNYDLAVYKDGKRIRSEDVTIEETVEHVSATIAGTPDEAGNTPRVPVPPGPGAYDYQHKQTDGHQPIISRNQSTGKVQDLGDKQGFEGVTSSRAAIWKRRDFQDTDRVTFNVYNKGVKVGERSIVATASISGVRVEVQKFIPHRRK